MSGSLRSHVDSTLMLMIMGISRQLLDVEWNDVPVIECDMAFLIQYVRPQ